MSPTCKVRPDRSTGGSVERSTCTGPAVDIARLRHQPVPNSPNKEDVFLQYPKMYFSWSLESLFFDQCMLKACRTKYTWERFEYLPRYCRLLPAHLACPFLGALCNYFVVRYYMRDMRNIKSLDQRRQGARAPTQRSVYISGTHQGRDGWNP